FLQNQRSQYHPNASTHLQDGISPSFHSCSFFLSPCLTSQLSSAYDFTPTLPFMSYRTGCPSLSFFITFFTVDSTFGLTSIRWDIDSFL
ncbi:MAG: hypothetical protein KAU84_02135, partial [Thermoplasmatales archaeon]|nr:hypothetical protein [Thermoplasmatales archaeon]